MFERLVDSVARAVLVAVVFALGAAALGVAGVAQADPADAPQPLPVFGAGPADFTPDTSIWPYTGFTDRISPEMAAAMSDSCQWFNAQFDTLAGQVYDFNRRLGDQHDDYAGLESQADVIVANLEQSTAFLAPRAQTLIIHNNLDNYGPYSPVRGAEPMAKLTFQLSRIGESIRSREPSGITFANVTRMTKWSDAVRGAHACG